MDMFKSTKYMPEQDGIKVFRLFPVTLVIIPLSASSTISLFCIPTFPIQARGARLGDG